MHPLPGYVKASGTEEGYGTDRTSVPYPCNLIRIYFLASPPFGDHLTGLQVPVELSDQPDAPVLVQKDPTAQEAQSDHLAATGWAVHQVAMG